VIAEDLAVARFSTKSGVAYLDKDVAYTAGILHDLGRLALAVLQPKQYANFLKSTKTKPCDVLAAEQELFGMDHCRAGRALIEAWRLPPELSEIAFQHHEPIWGPGADIVAAVRFGCRMADALGFEAARSIDPPTYEQLVGDLPEQERQHFGPTRDQYVAQIAHKIDSIESSLEASPAEESA
jgi:hypothetical protein